jgi:hypothetical protein
VSSKLVPMIGLQLWRGILSICVTVQFSQVWNSSQWRNLYLNLIIILSFIFVPSSIQDISATSTTINKIVLSSDLGSFRISYVHRSIYMTKLLKRYSKNGNNLFSITQIFLFLVNKTNSKCFSWTRRK